MPERSCKYEHDVRDMVRRSARGEAENPAIAAHAAGCAACAETLAVGRWMLDLAASPVAEVAPPPDPSFLWWRAETLRRWDAQQRAAAPIEIGERIQAGVGLAVSAGLLAWTWRLPPPAVAAIGVFLPAMIATAALVTVTAVVFVRNLLKGDA